jgi:hypothetical protein
MQNGGGWLTGWKEISEYAGLSGRTVQTYYKRYKMPIRRTPSGKPVALASELESWLIKKDWRGKK